MSLVEFSLKRRVTVSMAAVALVIFGFVAFTRLPMNLLPDISYPTLTVETRYPARLQPRWRRSSRGRSRRSWGSSPASSV